MKKFQQQLKQLREKQRLSTEAIASQINLSPTTIEMLENTEDLFLLKLPIQSLKNYFRKYGECLRMPEKRIISMLNRIDYLDYKRMRKASPKFFDYINRVLIVGLLILLGWIVYMLYIEQKANALKQNIVTLPSPVIINNAKKIKDTPASGQLQTLSSHQKPPEEDLATPDAIQTTGDDNAVININHHKNTEIIAQNSSEDLQLNGTVTK